MSKKYLNWPYVTLNVRPETREKIKALAQLKEGPRKKFERELESVDEILNRLLRAHEKRVLE